MDILPKTGDKIYVTTSLYVYRGQDDFRGGIATIDKIEYSENSLNHFISIKERPGFRYNYKSLMEKQEEYKEAYGDRIAHPDPDLRPAFNDDNEGWKTI